MLYPFELNPAPNGFHARFTATKGGKNVNGAYTEGGFSVSDRGRTVRGKVGKM